MLEERHDAHFLFQVANFLAHSRELADELLVLVNSLFELGDVSSTKGLQ